MTYDPPFLPEERADDETLQDRVARARRAREDAAARVAERYSKIKPDERKWRVREDLDLKSERMYVR